ncbi:MAG: tetratricopeptide repeat protein [Archangium sp.]|nr:tetratricopeptide repeat protein [Archangium sp.]
MRSLILALAVVSLAACKDEPFDTARLKGSELLQKNDFKGAAVEYEKSLELKPDQDTKVWDKAAFAYMKAGDFDKAASILEKSLDRRADQAAKLETVRNIAGMYYQQANDLDNAERFFQKAVELDPKDDQSLSWLAEISSKRGGARSQQAPADGTHLQKAIERYDAVIKVVPDKPEAYINKRIVLVKYIDHLTKQKLSILADAEAQKKDKEAYDSAMEQAADTEKRVTELKALLDETTKQLGAVNKAAKK